jgi:hypothetical protein
MSIYALNYATNYLSGPCIAVYNPLSENQEYKVYKNTITMTSGQVITGTITNNVINPFTGNCQSSTGSYTVQITNLTTNGCTCCTTLVALTPQQNLPVA